MTMGPEFGNDLIKLRRALSVMVGGAAGNVNWIPSAAPGFGTLMRGLAAIAGPGSRLRGLFSKAPESGTVAPRETGLAR